MNLKDRMKGYELTHKSMLPGNGYYVIRLDGRSFSKYTKRFKAPFDDLFISAMDFAAKTLCERVQGAKIAYVQSDEISLYFTDMDNDKSQLYFNGNVEKINSISASIVTNAFNKYLLLNTEVNVRDFKFAEFDCRVIELPALVEVHNCLLWRQQDNLRNSVAQVAQSHFSHKELHMKNNVDQTKMLKNIGDDWNYYPEGQKMGRIITKERTLLRSKWTIHPAKDMIEANYLNLDYDRN